MNYFCLYFVLDKSRSQGGVPGGVPGGVLIPFNQICVFVCPSEPAKGIILRFDCGMPDIIRHLSRGDSVYFNN